MCALPGTTSHPAQQQVEHLHHIEEQGHTGHHKHEDDEDGFLGGPGHVALYGEGTGLLRAREHGHHEKAIQIVLAHDEGGFDDDLGGQLGEVATQ